MELGILITNLLASGFLYFADRSARHPKIILS